MTAGMARWRRRGRSLLIDVLLACPPLVRGDAVAAAVRRELARRLDRPSDERARRLWARQLRSRNGAASAAASSAAVASSYPERLLPAMQQRAAAHPTEVATQLDLCALLRRAGRSAAAADVLTGLTEVGSRDIPRLLREALALGGRDDAAGLIRRVDAADPDAADRLRGALVLADAVPPRPLTDVVGEHEGDDAVEAAAVVYADGLREREALARMFLEQQPGPAAAVGAGLADDLRDDGDLRLSTALAQRALQSRPRDAGMRRLVTLGESQLRTLEKGWQPPPRGTATAAPADRRVHYLLHSSLPYTNLGYATRTQGLLHALRDHGWDVRGVTQPGYPEQDGAAERDVVDGVPYLRLPMDGALPHWPLSRMVEAYRTALAPLVAAERPGILHAASNFRNGLAAVDAARRAGLPSIYEVRGLWQLTRLVREPEFDSTEMFALLERLEAQAATLADRTIVITRALGDHLVDLGVPQERLVVVPNGVDTARFRPRERDTELAAQLGIAGRTVIGYVGGLVEYEGLDLLLEAAQALRAERDDFAVLVVGDGRSLPTLRAAAAERGIDDTVIFTGRVPHEDVERYYSLVDIAPFPRLPEQVCELVSPLKPFEAMAMGKVVVASDVAALAEIVDDGVTGRLFTKGSAAALAGVLRSLLDSPEQRAALADRGLRWVRDERDWAMLAPRVAQLYDELWERGTAPRR